MKISAFFIFVASAFAQTTPVTVTVTFPTAALMDVLTYNRNVWNDPATVATLSQSIGTTDTTLNVTSTNGYPTSGSLAIDSEEVAYTGVTASTFTGVTRHQRTSTAATHATGALVHLEKYGDNPALLKSMLLPAIQSIIQQQGTSSTYLATLAAAQATANANLLAALASTVQ